MKTVRVVINNRGLDELLHSRAVEQKLRSLAGEVTQEARSRAPVDEGDYRNSIRVDYHGRGKRPHARAVADDWKAGLMEHYYRVLGRAADAAR